MSDHKIHPDEGCDRHGKFMPACEECFAPPRDTPPASSIEDDELYIAPGAVEKLIVTPSEQDERDWNEYLRVTEITENDGCAGEAIAKHAWNAARAGMVSKEESDRDFQNALIAHAETMKGMVPASEADKWKTLYREQDEQTRMLIDEAEEAATMRERKRILGILKTFGDEPDADVLRVILNPQETGRVK